MPWGEFKLSNGSVMPAIAFGTWKLGKGSNTVDYVDTALEVGFSHVDTAQAYTNEEEAGLAIKESGLARSDIFVTTKYSGVAGKGIDESIHDSLKNLGLKYVDLYLIHHPRLAQPDIPTAWKQMEALYEQGLVKNIGVSNFNVAELTILLASAKIKPAANQILFYPDVLPQQLPIHEFGTKNGVVTEGYSTLIPITQYPGGAVDKALGPIAEAHGATKDQILMAWAKSKGVLVVTSSTKQSRMEGYLAAGDIELTEEEVIKIDTAGVLAARRQFAKTIVRRAAGLGLLTACVLGAASYFGIQVL